MTLVLFSNRGHYNACVGHYYACVDIWLCVCAVCATCTCVRGFVCWHPTFQLFGSAFVCWNATFQLFFFCSAPCCCCCIMSVSHRPSSSQALYLLGGNHGPIAVADQALPFVTAMDGASVVCVFAQCFLSTYW